MIYIARAGMENITPEIFSRIFITNDILEENLEVEFNFSGIWKSLQYIFVIRNIYNDRFVVINNICGGNLYVKKINNINKDIVDALKSFAEINEKNPMFLVDTKQALRKLKRRYREKNMIYERKGW